MDTLIVSVRRSILGEIPRRWGPLGIGTVFALALGPVACGSSTPASGGGGSGGVSNTAPSGNALSSRAGVSYVNVTTGRVAQALPQARPAPVLVQSAAR